MGEALAVYGHNKTEEVEQFLSYHKINGLDLVFSQHAGTLQLPPLEIPLRIDK